MRRIALIGLLALAATATARADDAETDRVLKNVFPAQAVNNAGFKFVDLANGKYAIAASITIVRGEVILMDAIWAQKRLDQLNNGQVLHTYAAWKMTATFARPVNIPHDMSNNPLKSLIRERSPTE